MTENDIRENIKIVYTMCITNALRNNCFNRFHMKDDNEKNKSELMRQLTLHVIADNIVKKHITMEEIEKNLFIAIGEAIYDIRTELEKIIIKY